MTTMKAPQGLTDAAIAAVHRVVFQPAGRQADVADGTVLLDAARTMGVEIEAICGGRQTCGKCQVTVEEGHFPKLGLTSDAANLGAPDAREERFWERHPRLPGRRLSCVCQVHGDLLVSVPEESQARKQVIRKAATERPITVDPAIRLYYVEIDDASLEDPLGDWDRIAAELEARFGLPGVRLDPVLLPGLQEAVRAEDHKLTVTVWQGGEAVRVVPGYSEEAYGLAVDIGTTTVALHLCDLRTGVVLATTSQMNPQVAYGEDLMSRISFVDSRPDGLAMLHGAIIDALNRLKDEACAIAGVAPDAITDAVLVGNTTMHHLLLNISPHQLGQSPFAPAVSDAVDLKARDLGLNLAPGAQVHVLPIEAGHVGADNVGVLLAEEPFKLPEDQVTLIVDVGTNGELLLGNRRQVLSASSPTGPAFEGAQIRHGMRAAAGAIERVRIDPETLEARFKVIGRDAWSNDWETARESRQQKLIKATGICGSGIIEAIAELFLAGLLTPDGRFAPEARSGRLRWQGAKAEYVLALPEQTSTGREVVVTSDDVRNIQLAKAALYSGARLLMERMGVDHVDRVALAGAFGSYIDPFHAMVLGMIPDCDLDHVLAVGNAAGDGARIALLNREQRASARRLARWVTYVGIALEPRFQDAFVEALPLPHGVDAFPHLAGALDAATALRRGRGTSDTVSARSRRRARTT
jgi:uncharacterized 2Fe-2S/4Fe-4S cluster protein (DUF4445 family)